MITIEQARQYYDLGIITRYELARGIAPGSWLVFIYGKENREWTLHNAHNKPREFKTVEAALNAIESTGMRINTLSIRAD